MYLLLLIMSYLPTCHISLGTVQMTQVESVNIKKSIEAQTQTATVTFPKAVYFKNDNKKRVSEVLKVGDVVTIDLGYNGKENREFDGYIVRVEQTIPVVVHIEDEMYILKKTIVEPKQWEAATLGDVLNYIAPNVSKNVVDTSLKLGKFAIDKVSAATVLKYISDNYSLCCFFKGKVLQVGFPYSFVPDNVVYVYDFQRNVPADGRNLQFMTKDVNTIKIKAISNLKTGKKLIVWLPSKDAEGDIRSLNFPEMTEAELTKLAQAELDKFQYEGYKGSVKGFGLPFVQLTEAVRLRDNEYKDQEGNYLVDAVEVDFQVNEFRRECTLGKRV